MVTKINKTKNLPCISHSTIMTFLIFLCIRWLDILWGDDHDVMYREAVLWSGELHVATCIVARLLSWNWGWIYVVYKRNSTFNWTRFTTRAYKNVTLHLVDHKDWWPPKTPDCYFNDGKLWKSITPIHLTIMLP